MTRVVRSLLEVRGSTRTGKRREPNPGKVRLPVTQPAGHIPSIDSAGEILRKNCRRCNAKIAWDALPPVILRVHSVVLSRHAIPRITYRVLAVLPAALVGATMLVAIPAAAEVVLHLVPLAPAVACGRFGSIPVAGLVMLEAPICMRVRTVTEVLLPVIPFSGPVRGTRGPAAQVGGATILQIGH